MTRSRRKRVLLVKLGAIGDVVMLIPAAYALHLQGYDVHWLCGSTVAPLLACYPWIRTVVAEDTSLLTGSLISKLKAVLSVWKSLAGCRYDLCATLYYDRRYRLLTLPVLARQRLMLSPTRQKFRLLPGRHHSDEYARILLGRLGLDSDWPHSMAPVPPGVLPPSPLPRGAVGVPRVVLVPAGAKNLLRDDALRRWPLENYVALAERLLSSQIEILLLGGPDDHWAVPAFAGLPVVNLIGNLPLERSIALMNDSDVLVTHDTGPLHLGGISGIGIVSIFGPTDPQTRIPSRPGTLAIWGGETLPCRPCYDGAGYPPCPRNTCMHQVTVDIVFSEVMSMLTQRGRGLEQLAGSLPHRG